MPKRKQTISRSNRYYLEYTWYDNEGNAKGNYSGFGEFISIDYVQSQIDMLKRVFGPRVEIVFTRDGQMLDYNGKPTDKPIRYE